MNVDLSEEEARGICELIAWRRSLGSLSTPDAYQKLYVKARAVLQVRRDREIRRKQEQRQETPADAPPRDEVTGASASASAAGRALVARLVEAEAVAVLVARLVEAEATAVLIGLTLRQGVRRAFWYSTVLAEDPEAEGQATDWDRVVLEAAVHALASRIDRR